MDSLAKVGLGFRAPSSEQCLYPVFQKEGGSVGAFATRTDDILGRGEQDALTRIRVFLEYHLGTTKVRESPLVHARTHPAQESDFPEKLS